MLFWAVKYCGTGRYCTASLIGSHMFRYSRTYRIGVILSPPHPKGLRPSPKIDAPVNCEFHELVLKSLQRLVVKLAYLQGSGCGLWLLGILLFNLIFMIWNFNIILLYVCKYFYKSYQERFRKLFHKNNLFLKFFPHPLSFWSHSFY